MTTHTYTVEGMTCAHCAGAVSREVGKISGVSDIAVDVADGTLTITVDGPVPDRDVVAAVDEAGYAVVLN